jgi:membrane associated rhomboid family serine protease
MGIYNRDYYQDQPNWQGGTSVSSWDAWKVILGLNVIVFILQVVTYHATPFGGKSVVTDWLCLNSNAIQSGQIWRCLTYAFCHSERDLWHIFFNMLQLFFFGQEIERRIGRNEFFRFYCFAAIISGLGQVIISILGQSPSNTVGASGAVMALMVLYAYWYPTREILLMGIIPLQMWILAIFLVGSDLMMILQQAKSNHAISQIAHACHLGGAVFGYLYGAQQWRLDFGFLSGQWWSEKIKGRQLQKRVRDSKFKVYAPNEDEPVTTGPYRGMTDAAFKAREDQILQKIHDQGESGLTDEERQFLKEASLRYKRKHQH